MDNLRSIEYHKGKTEERKRKSVEVEYSHGLEEEKAKMEFKTVSKVKAEFTSRIEYIEGLRNKMNDKQGIFGEGQKPIARMQRIANDLSMFEAWSAEQQRPYPSNKSKVSIPQLTREYEELKQKVENILSN